MSNLSAVTIPVMRTTWFVANFTRDSFPATVNWHNWPIVDRVGLDVPHDLYLWPEGQEAPELAVLCTARDDPKQYRVFKRSADVLDEQYLRTGMAYAGRFSEWQWKRFAEKLPGILEFHRVTDEDPPGLMDEAMRLIRAGD